MFPLEEIAHCPRGIFLFVQRYVIYTKTKNGNTDNSIFKVALYGF